MSTPTQEFRKAAAVVASCLRSYQRQAYQASREGLQRLALSPREFWPPAHEEALDRWQEAFEGILTGGFPGRDESAFQQAACEVVARLRVFARMARNARETTDPEEGALPIDLDLREFWESQDGAALLAFDRAVEQLTGQVRLPLEVAS
jgi:hypothetical protein